MDVSTLSDIVREVSKRTGFPEEVVKENVDVMLMILKKQMKSSNVNVVYFPFLGRMTVPRVNLEYYIKKSKSKLSDKDNERLAKKLENLKELIKQGSLSLALNRAAKNRPLERRKKYRGKYRFNDYASNEEYQNNLADRLNNNGKD